MEADIAALEDWVGRVAETTDVVTPRLVAEFEATFAPNLAPAPSGNAPSGLHWCLAPAIVPLAEVGPDGHPARGGFLPPVSLPRRMWAGGEIETLDGLRIGDEVIRRSVIDGVSMKAGRSGPLCFVAVRQEYHTARGLALQERQDIVYRGAATGPAVGPAPAASRAADLSWTLEATPVQLFRYSALTFNGHRIHYDLPYAMQAEAYPGLVVHGPLQATLLFNLASVLTGGTPHRFRYRGHAPLTAGTRFRIAGCRHGEGQADCWTEGSEGVLHMTADTAAA